MTVSPGSVALSVLGFLDVAAPDFVDVAAEAGFDAVSLRVVGGDDGSPAELATPLDVARTARRLRDTGLGVVDVEVLRLGPELQRRQVEWAVSAATELGAPRLLAVDSGWGTPEPLVDQLRWVDELAGRAGLRTCLEFMPFSRCPDLPSAVDVALAAGVGVLVDLLHLVRSGGDAAQLAEVVARHPGLVSHVQLCDAPAASPQAGELREEAVSRRLLPGHGHLGVHGLLAALPPGLPWAVEAPTAAHHRTGPRLRALETMQAVRDLQQELVGPVRTRER